MIFHMDTCNSSFAFYDRNSPIVPPTTITHQCDFFTHFRLAKGEQHSDDKHPSQWTRHHSGYLYRQVEQRSLPLGDKEGHEYVDDSHHSNCNKPKRNNVISSQMAHAITFQDNIVCKINYEYSNYFFTLFVFLRNLTAKCAHMRFYWDSTFGGTSPVFLSHDSRNLCSETSSKTHRSVLLPASTV